MQNIPIILHIPHSSIIIPRHIRESLLLSDEELADEILRLTDYYTEELFASMTAEIASPVIFPVNRIVTDPERFTDKNNEPMEKHGMGAVYTLTLNGKPLRNGLTEHERIELLDTYYYPHHNILYNNVKKHLEITGRCLIIDCHSFPSLPFPFEANQELERPDICIGTDDFHTPGWLAMETARLFRNYGYTVAFNHPFAGCLVPLPYYRINSHVHSLMIEINRKCYMKEKTGLKHSTFRILQEQLAEILQNMKNSTAFPLF